MSEQVLLFGEADHLEYGLHLFECAVPLFCSFSLVELDECNEEFRLVLAEPKPACDLGDALA